MTMQTRTATRYTSDDGHVIYVCDSCGSICGSRAEIPGYSSVSKRACLCTIDEQMGAIECQEQVTEAISQLHALDLQLSVNDEIKDMH
jgi:hypothetical protein